jgi:hypothetical protein
MAYFAKLNENNIVTQVVSVNNNELLDSNGVEQEQKGIDFLKLLYDEPNSKWIQTSYNTRNNKHLNEGTPFRGNYASLNYVWDEINQIFYPQKPYPSWTLDLSISDWTAPVARPEGPHYWDEDSLSWIPLAVNDPDPDPITTP